MFRRFAPAVAVVLASLSHVAAAAEKFDFAAALPPQTLAYAELSAPDRLLDAALGDRLQALLGHVPGYRKYLESKDYRTLQSVVSLLESKLDVDWRSALRTLVGGGASLSFDPSQNAVVLMVRSRDPALLTKLHAAIIDLIEADAASKGRASTAKSEEYEGVTGWSFGKNEAHAIVDDLLLVSNKAEALQAWIDRRRADERPETLADDETFQQARAVDAEGSAGFGFLRLAPLKLLAKFADKKSDNPLVELLVGGIADALAGADYATLRLRHDDDGARLSARLPFDRKQLSAARRWYFAADADPRNARIPEVSHLLASLAVRRDVGGLWTSRGELFDEKTNVGFTQADTNLGLYFSGRDFGTQVLGEIGPTWRIVSAATPRTDDGQPVPALKLPATAVVWELRNPDAFAPHLQMAFQNIIGITNIDGVQKGRAQLLLKTERRGEAEIQYGTYLVVGEPSKTDAPVQFNFRPACAVAGKYFVVGTHVALVRELVDALAAGSTSTSSATGSLADGEHLKFTVRGAELVELLQANRPLIVGRSLLSSGGDQQQAAEQLDGAVEALGAVSTFEVRLTDEGASLGATVEWRLE